VTLPDGQTAWLIAHYDDVASALKDERLAKDKLQALTQGQVAKQRWVPAMFKPLERNMLDLDPPDHTRLRGLVHKAFTPGLVEQMRPRIEALSGALLDAVQTRGRIDLIHDYALPVPTTIIAEMLGVCGESCARSGSSPASSLGTVSWSSPSDSLPSPCSFCLETSDGRQGA
jgi:cytochrome P450 PksS